MGLTIGTAQTISMLNIFSNLSRRTNNLFIQLSTGKKINTGADNPSGLIAISNLTAELTSVDAAISNNQRTDSMLNVADGALGEISGLLTEIETLVVASASDSTLTSAEIAANQTQIDQAIASIDRIVSTTKFNGKRLLDGSQAILTSGVDSTKIRDMHVHRRPSGSTSSTITVALGSAAAKATSTSYATDSATTATTIAITGALGTATIDIAAGENLSSIAAKIQAVGAQTGVTASASIANDQLDLVSTTYGDDAYISVENLSGDSTNFANLAKTSGSDATVTVNGQTANVDGLTVNFNSAGVSMSFTLTEDYNEGTVSGDESFTVSGGGATFQLGTNSSTRATIGISGLYSHQLGSNVLGYLYSLKSGGSADLNSDPTQAAAIVKEAAGQVALTRGRVGGFQRLQVASSINTLSITKTALTSARSTIQDVDYAKATAELNRNKILMQASISLMAIASQQNNLILNLLM